ncbi:MAG: MAPEG family protein [Solimonas sp.]
MTIALWCVLVAALLPFPFALAAKSSRRFDNATPREYIEQTTGWRKRAHWAQVNGFETFPPFAAAVVIAHLVAGPNATADALAVAFIVLRVLYGLCYIADKATLRSTVWADGFACVIGLFVVAARTPGA